MEPTTAKRKALTLSQLRTKKKRKTKESSLLAERPEGMMRPQHFEDLRRLLINNAYKLHHDHSDTEKMLCFDLTNLKGFNLSTAPPFFKRYMPSFSFWPWPKTGEPLTLTPAHFAFMSKYFFVHHFVYRILKNVLTVKITLSPELLHLMTRLSDAPRIASLSALLLETPLSRLPWEIDAISSTQAFARIHEPFSFRWGPGTVQWNAPENMLAALKASLATHATNVRIVFCRRAPFALYRPACSLEVLAVARQHQLLVVFTTFDHTDSTTTSFQWDAEMAAGALHQAHTDPAVPMETHVARARRSLPEITTVDAAPVNAGQAFQLALRDQLSAGLLAARRRRIEAVTPPLLCDEVDAVLSSMPDALDQVLTAVARLRNLSSCRAVYRPQGRGYYDAVPQSRDAQAAYLDAEASGACVLLWDVSVVAAFDGTASIRLTGDIQPDFRLCLAYPLPDSGPGVGAPCAEPQEELETSDYRRQMQRRQSYEKRVELVEKSSAARRTVELRLGAVAAMAKAGILNVFPSKRELLGGILQPGLGMAPFLPTGARMIEGNDDDKDGGGGGDDDGDDEHDN